MVLSELKIHELCAETYNGMIRLLKLGCRTLLLIVDRESKEKLVAKFYEHGLSPSLATASPSSRSLTHQR